MSVPGIVEFLVLSAILITEKALPLKQNPTGERLSLLYTPPAHYPHSKPYRALMLRVDSHFQNNNHNNKTFGVFIECLINEAFKVFLWLDIWAVRTLPGHNNQYPGVCNRHSR